MTHTVFLSGSRKISRLNEAIRNRLKNIIDQEMRVVIGDANGADRAIQAYFADAHYDDVTIFCSGSLCRNNVGAWPIEHVEASSKLRGRDFFEVKDMAMTEAADYGFVLWDGDSVGSLKNVERLLKQSKPVVVYLGSRREFHHLKHFDDLAGFLRKGEGKAA